MMPKNDKEKFYFPYLLPVGYVDNSSKRFHAAVGFYETVLPCSYLMWGREMSIPSKVGFYLYKWFHE